MMLARNEEHISDLSSDKVNSAPRKNRRSRVRQLVDRERVRERLAALGVSASQAARSSGLARTFVVDLLNRREPAINGVNLCKLARGLACDPRYLTGESDQVGIAPLPNADEPPRKTYTKPIAKPATPPRTVAPLRGLIEAGAFRDTPKTVRAPRVPVPVDPRYAGISQGVYAVESAELLRFGIGPNSFLLMVEAEGFIERFGGYRAGQLVVVSERNASGQEALSVRRVVVFADRTELLGADPDDVLILGNPPEGRTVSVKGVVIKAVAELD
jgi:hypothetical protein